MTAADLLGVRNTIGVDIGEGTVNFPVFTGGKFNAEAASTLTSGYGTVLEKSKDSMDTAGLQFTSRKQLSEFLVEMPSVFLRGRHNQAQSFVDVEAEYLVEEIVPVFREAVAQAGASTEVVYVYGGGAWPIRDLIVPALSNAANGVPVLLIDEGHSRHLNREGLYLVAQAEAAKVWSDEDAEEVLS